MSINIVAIDTKPVHDPYVNIEGIASTTYLKIDPRDKTVWVTQEYNDNSTPIDEWNGHITTWQVPGHPTAVSMRAWLEEHLGDFVAICEGYESQWDGYRNVGWHSDDAQAIIERIERELDSDAGPADYYRLWPIEEWLEPVLGNIAADTTDKELALYAEDWEASDENVVSDDILDYITSHRDNLLAEAQEEDNYTGGSAL